jgi:hypothetical protein
MAALPLLPRPRTAMKALNGLLIATMLAIGPGCVTSDRIDGTPLMVDVSGIWAGVVEEAGTNVSFDLEQHGSAVRGALQGRTPGVVLAGVSTVVGIVAGDVFQFRDTRGDLQGELQVSGDEMTGTMARVGPGAAATAGGACSISLRRVDPSSPSGTPRWGGRTQ